MKIINRKYNYFHSFEEQAGLEPATHNWNS